MSGSKLLMGSNLGKCGNLWGLKGYTAHNVQITVAYHYNILRSVKDYIRAILTLRNIYQRNGMSYGLNYINDANRHC